MGKDTPLELTKIKNLVSDIREFPTKIDSAELAKNARKLLKKYALLSEKIERNILIRVTHHKDLATIRSKEFKAIRRTLKEQANLMLHAKNNKTAKSEKVAKKPVKTPGSKKTAKAVEDKEVKKAGAKKTVKKASPKPVKAKTSKEDV